MTQSKIIIERGQSFSEPIVLQPTERFDSTKDLELFQKALLNLINQQFQKIVVNLQSVPLPSTSFIAFLIEAASRMRRENREFFISQLSNSARVNISSFSPLSFFNEIRDGEEIRQKTKTGDVKAAFSTLSAEDLSSEDLSSIEDKNIDPQKEHLIEEEIGSAFDFDIIDSATKLEEEDLDRPFTLYDDEEEVQKSAPEENSMLREEKKADFHIVVRSREKDLYQITDFVIHHAREAGFSETEVGKIKIAAYEAAINVVEHAYKYQDQHFIDVIVKYDSDNFTIVLMDHGKSFDFDKQMEPYSAHKAVERKQTGGFGLYIMKRSMDEIKYESDPVWGNKLTMTKRIPH